MAIAVDGTWDALGFDRIAQDLEVAGRILLVPKDGGRDRPGRVVDRPDQGQPRTATLEPVVTAPIELEEEPLGAHPRSTAAVPRWPPSTWAGDTLGTQDLTHALAAHDDRLTFGQELTEVAVVDLAVRRPKLDDPRPHAGTELAARRAAAVAVDQPGRALALERHPQAPELPLGYVEGRGTCGHCQLTRQDPRQDPGPSLLGRGHRDRLLHLRRLTESLCS